MTFLQRSLLPRYERVRLERLFRFWSGATAVKINAKYQMPNIKSMPNEKNPKYDLEERITSFGESLIAFLKTLKETTLNRSCISQIIRSGTSIGANYYEADAAESKKDFQHKMAICKKEAKETCYWLRILSNLHPERKEELRTLWKEVHEFVLIFSASILTSRKGSQK